MKEDEICYLAHCINSRKEIRAWQLHTERNYKMKFLNPFYRNKWEERKVQEIEKTKSLRDMKTGLPELTIRECLRIMVEDLKLIDKADSLVTIITESSFGTAQEIFYCAYVLKKPVYIITERYIAHPWLRSCAFISNGVMFKTISEFEKFIINNGLVKRKQ
jgi:hypothetical protein